MTRCLCSIRALESTLCDTFRYYVVRDRIQNTVSSNRTNLWYTESARTRRITALQMYREHIGLQKFDGLVYALRKETRSMQHTVMSLQLPLPVPAFGRKRFAAACWRCPTHALHLPPSALFAPALLLPSL